MVEPEPRSGGGGVQNQFHYQPDTLVGRGEKEEEEEEEELDLVSFFGGRGRSSDGFLALARPHHHVCVRRGMACMWHFLVATMADLGSRTRFVVKQMRCQTSMIATVLDGCWIYNYGAAIFGNTYGMFNFDRTVTNSTHLVKRW